MLHFLRRIRKRLLGQNRIQKYILYAVGEIALVVVGILIAVQINSWNQNKKRLAQEKVLLEQLRSELIRVFNDISTDYTFLRAAGNSHFIISNAVANNLPYNDTLCFHFELMTKDEYIYPKNAAYGKIKDEGMDIIRNDTIRNLAQVLYETVYPRISKGNSFTRDITELLTPYYIRNFKPNTNANLRFSIYEERDSISDIILEADTITYPYYRTINNRKQLFTYGYVPNNFERLKKDGEFLMLLKGAIQYRGYKIGRYSAARRMTRELVGRIDKELKKP